MKAAILSACISLLYTSSSLAFVIPSSPLSSVVSSVSRRCTNVNTRTTSATPSSSSSSALFALDPVTYLRTEWVSAALCTNQTPRSADVVLQLGCEDGRVVNFVPRTVREIITSSAESKDSPEGGGLTVACERQLKQMGGDCGYLMDIGQSLDEDEEKSQKCVSRGLTNEGAGGLWSVAGCKKLFYLAN
eukprot:scaffold4240_cov212-Alexandrium_tamarense.AAC.4